MTDQDLIRADLASYNPALIRRSEKFSTVLTSLAILIAVLALIGWWQDILLFKNVVYGLTAMNPATAVCILLAAGSVLSFRTTGFILARAVGFFCAALVVLAGVFCLSNYWLVLQSSVDRWLFVDRLGDSRMAPNTALSFIFLGSGLLLFSFRSRFSILFSQALIIGTLLISLMALVGYLYNFTSLYQVSSNIPMALNTAVAFLLLGSAVFCARPRAGYMALLTSAFTGGQVARWALPVTLLVPPLLGGLRLYGERRGFYTTEFGLSLTVAAYILIFNLLIWGGALWVNRADARRRAAEEELKISHAALEVKVRERTTELEQKSRELERALQNLKVAQKQMVLQERMRALGEMASGIAHDFNNALMPVLGYSELIIESPDLLRDPAKCAEYLKHINTAAKDASGIVNRLRQFYRFKDEGDRFAPVQVNDVITQSMSLTEPKWKTQSIVRGVSIAVRSELQELPPVDASESQLREVLTNLIFNAVDAMPGGGTITLRTFKDGGYAAIEVRDTGMGMSPEVREHCLEPFFTTKGDRGTGLGLAMVYGIIQRHSGMLKIESEKGRGTSIFIYLPLKSSKTDDAREPGARLCGPVPRPLRILFADDDPGVRELIKRYLEYDSHQVILAENGSEALEKFRSSPEKFDLVITDRVMPGMNGDQLALEIKKLMHGQPVLMLTGAAGLVKEELPEKVDLIISKPVTLEQLRQGVRKLRN